MNVKTLHVYHKAGDEIMPEAMKPLADHWRLLQHRILTRRWQKQTDESGRYTPLKWDYLAAELTPQATSKVLKWAKGSKHLICDGDYSEGEKSFGYRMSDALEAQRTVRTALSDAGLVTRIKAVEKRDSRHYTKAHRHLRRWLNETSVAVGAIDAAEAISETEAAKESNVWSIRMLMEGDFTFSTCHYGRVHTNITRLHRPLRSFLRIGGERLVNLDIANSQPLFLGMAMLNVRLRSSPVSTQAPVLGVTPHPAILTCEYAGSGSQDDGYKHRNPKQPQEGRPPSPAHTLGTLPPIRPQIEVSESHKQYNTQPLMVDFKKPQTGLKPVTENDLKNYLDTCQRGELYGTLMRGMKWEGTKDEFKRNVWFHFLYGSNKRPDQLKVPERKNLRRLNEVFCDLYPSVYEWVWGQKRVNYKRLAWEMQRAESRLMIDCVGGRLACEYPDIPILSIHDSYLTPMRCVDTVRRIIEEEFGKLKIRPTIGAEVYDHDEGHEESDYVDPRAAEAA
jgi:hypothetical protein